MTALRRSTRTRPTPVSCGCDSEIAGPFLLNVSASKDSKLQANSSKARNSPSFANPGAKNLRYFFSGFNSTSPTTYSHNPTPRIPKRETHAVYSNRKRSHMPSSNLIPTNVRHPGLIALCQPNKTVCGGRHPIPASARRFQNAQPLSHQSPNSLYPLFAQKQKIEMKRRTRKRKGHEPAPPYRQQTRDKAERVVVRFARLRQNKPRLIPAPDAAEPSTTRITRQFDHLAAIRIWPSPRS
jgi:hypothetical protein